MKIYGSKSLILNCSIDDLLVSLRDQLNKNKHFGYVNASQFSIYQSVADYNHNFFLFCFRGYIQQERIKLSVTYSVYLSVTSLIITILFALALLIGIIALINGGSFWFAVTGAVLNIILHLHLFWQLKVCISNFEKLLLNINKADGLRGQGDSSVVPTQDSVLTTEDT